MSLLINNNNNNNNLEPFNKHKPNKNRTRPNNKKWKNYSTKNLL